MSRQQATRANRAQVLEHIQRQRVLGEEMQSYKEVTPRMLITTLVLIAAFFAVLRYTGV